MNRKINDPKTSQSKKLIGSKNDKKSKLISEDVVDTGDAESISDSESVIKEFFLDDTLVMKINELVFIDEKYRNSADRCGGNHMLKTKSKAGFVVNSKLSSVSDNPKIIRTFADQNLDFEASLSLASSLFSAPDPGRKENEVVSENREKFPEKEYFMRDLNYTLNELQDSFAQSRDPASLAEREKPVVINGVRITPGTMLFKDAYDGKSYNQTLTITNCGKHSVCVRIFPPTSKAFKIKPAKTGHILSSGITLTRKIRFLYTKPTAIPQALMDIYINNTCYRYELLVITCYTQISVTPKIMDFGDIDVGMVSAIKFLTITNTGTKQAHFSIDLGRNQIEVSIEPMKGTVQPNESKVISVEIFGTTEGEFQQEFWIKTEPLQRVYIQGTFIEPSLKVDYPIADKDFLILHFPKTFVGVRQQRNVVIKNHSSTSAIFCVMGRYENEKLPLKALADKDINYKQFYVNPTEGRLHSDQQYIMGITFVPQKPKNRPDYYVCSVVVDVKRCRIGNASNQLDQVEPHTVAPSAPLLDTISISTFDENENEEEVNAFNDMVTVLLYGEVEIPNITTEPKKIYLSELKLREVHVEEIKILNNSKTLPLIIKYNKIACVEVEPKTVLLPPNVPVDLTVRLRPSRMGVTNTDIIFDVFYRQYERIYKVGTVALNVLFIGKYNPDLKLLKKRDPYFIPGITPLVTHEVGYQVEDIRFNSEMEKPRQAIVDKQFVEMDKTNDALIAFPNDIPKSMRPWRNTVPCKTIFAKLPRIITQYDEDYDLSPKQQVLQDNNQSYYRKYIKGLALKQHKIKNFEEVCEDYVTTNQKLVFMQNLKLTPEYIPILNNLNKQSLFVPLTPYELHKVIVTPKFIQLGKLAAHTECSNHFRVENKNDFPVHISIKALYSSITIVQELFTLAPNSQKNINFTYHSESSGTHHMPVFVILNFFHVFDVTVLAKIVSNTVKCITKDVLIVPTERTTFLELRNPINSDVKFTIDTTFFHLESFPCSGIIPAKRNMTCTITFNPEVGFMPVKEIAVVSESGAKELVEVHFDRKKAPVGLSTNLIDFGNTPLNTSISKELIIKNHSDQLVPVNVEFENSEWFPEITINPVRSLIWQKGDIVIKFTLLLTEVVKFSFPVKIVFQYEYIHNVTVTGNVIFPEVNLRPDLLKMPKIPSGSIVSSPFKVINTCTVTNFLSFPLQDFSEFTIKTKTGQEVSNGVTLAPKERKELYLEFSPQEPVAYCIYLPYILNGIIGPPELNRPDSIKCSEYLATVQNDYKTSEESCCKLKVIKVLCAAGKKWLHFSSLKLKFCSFNRTEQEFVITNISDVSQEITFQLDNLEYFNFIPTEFNMAVVDDNFITNLEPEESYKITINFDPVTYGTFTRNVPILVKEYSETLEFNHLQLIGSHPEPKIVISKKLCSFLPTSIGSRLEKVLTVELLAHTCDGQLDIECDDAHIDVVFMRRENISDMKAVLYYTVMFGPIADCVIETKVKFSCPCETSAEMEVFACGDSSLVINFMSDPKIVEQSTYPYFPEKDDKSNYAIFMHSIIPIVERWLYSQGFVYSSYYKIPDDIARFPMNVEVKKKSSMGGKRHEDYLPLVQLLINLMDRSILKYIDNQLQPTQDIAGKTLYNYVTYRNTISFLKSQEIHVPGLKPEHLMAYEEYVYFRKNLVDPERTQTDETFSEDRFYRFSKQKWLDLFLKIYKVLVFQRIVDPKTIPPQKSGSRLRQTPPEETDTENDFLVQDKEAFEKYIKKKFKRFPNWFMCDAKLLLWLEFHYNRQREILWPNEDFGSYRYFDSFANIDDSVALATVTVAYCPYLTKQLSDVYACPKSVEHRVHNACKVVQVWKNLKLSFDIHPQTIVAANRIKIMFIVTYLYEVLPHFYPTHEVTIEAPLSNSASYELNVTNCGDASIKYVAIFFGEGSELFKVDNPQIVIAAKQVKKIKLTYLAKKVLEAKSILVLSGEASAQKYAKTMAVSVTGIPNTSECQEIKIQVDTYETARKKISLQSPYGKTYTAKISMCFEEPKSYKDFHSISAIKAHNIPREINVTQNNCKFLEKGDTHVNLDMCFISQGLKSFYLYFCNNVIGDFCVLISIMSVTKKYYATTCSVQLPDASTATCSCKQGFNIHCQQAFKVQIPCRNLLLWKSTPIVVGRSFSDSITLRLMKKFFGTPLIFRLLKYYLERFPQGYMLPSSIFEDHAEYVITPNKKFTPQRPTVKIRDVTSEDSVSLIIHWNDQEVPNEEYVELRNTNDKEIRYLKLVFIKPEPSIVSVEESLVNESKSKSISSKSVSGSVSKGKKL